MEWSCLRDTTLSTSWRTESGECIRRPTACPDDELESRLETAEGLGGQRASRPKSQREGNTAQLLPEPIHTRTMTIQLLYVSIWGLGTTLMAPGCIVPR